MNMILKPNRSLNPSRAGVALMYATMASVVGAGMVATLVTLAGVSDRTANNKRHQQEAQYIAEGALELAKKEIQGAIANWREVPTQGTVEIGGHPAVWSVTPTGFSDTVTDAQGVQTLVTSYELRARANIAGVETEAARILNAEATPLFQYAVFYTNDLEINPGPNMTIRGRVHSNADMYLNCGGTLTLDSNYVRAVGEVHRNRKDNPGLSEGTVTIRDWVKNPFNALEPSSYHVMQSKGQMTNLGITTTSGLDHDFLGHDANGDGDLFDAGDWIPWGPLALQTWDEPDTYSGGSGSTVQDSAHGVTEAVTPQIGSVSMFESAEGGDYAWNPATSTYEAVAPGTGTHSKGFYHDNAGLSILAKPDGTWKAYDGSGNDISAAVSSAVTIQQMYDARQANGSSTKIKLVQVDIGLLQATGKFPSNGLVYAAWYGQGTGTNCKGVRLKNGATLPAKLTVVSEDPVYVWGDYNKNSKKGAAIIGDAVNLLSNTWNDSKTRGTLPTAGNTTYNVAMIGGNLDTSVGSYNGGFENLPRFHENWTGKTATITGSFVNTWRNQWATGAWVYGGDRYTAPNRVWSYDTAFNNVNNLPPFTPMAVSARDVVIW